MNLQELKALLEKLCLLPSETEWVEFKEAKNNIHFDNLGKYFSAQHYLRHRAKKNSGMCVASLAVFN